MVPKKVPASTVSTAKPSADDVALPAVPPRPLKRQPSLSERKPSADLASVNQSRWSESHSVCGNKSIKRNRRSKDETGSRNFLCGCGKSYLSYPALYTHAKTKHNNVFPPGTTNLEKPLPSADKGGHDPGSACGLQRIYTANRAFHIFLKQIPGCFEPRDLPSKYLIENFPCEIFKHLSLYNKLLISVERLRKELIEEFGPGFMRRLDAIIFEINNPRRLSVYGVLALFLMHLFRFVSSGFYRDVVFLAVCLLLFLQQTGWQRVEHLVELDRPDQVSDFCDGSFAEFLPDFVDPFVGHFLGPCLVPGRVVTGPGCLAYFGVGSDRLFWLLGTVKFFCEFLELNRFSRGRLVPL